MAGKTRTADDLPWRAWATNDEGITGEKLLLFVNDTLFAALKGMQLSPPSNDPVIEMLRLRRTLMKSALRAELGADRALGGRSGAQISLALFGAPVLIRRRAHADPA